MRNYFDKKFPGLCRIVSEFLAHHLMLADFISSSGNFGILRVGDLFLITAARRVQYTAMLQSLSIQNFRQFRDLQIEPLRRINLIAGRNNSGKTALLEALYLLFAKPDTIAKFPAAFRSSHGSPADDFLSFWLWLPYQQNLQNSISIIANHTENDGYVVESNTNLAKDRLSFTYKTRRQLTHALGTWQVHSNGEISFKRSPPWPAVTVFSTRPSLPTEDAEDFNRIAAKRGGRQKLTELLQKVEPNLHELQYLKLGSQPLVYADVGLPDLVPMTQLGQGFIRLLRIFAAALLSESKIILIDEIENGIGYRAQVDLWKGLAANARQEDVQVFATTHSYECIQAAHEVFATDDQYDFALHRLERTDHDEIHVVTYDQETLSTSIELNFEVR